MYKEEDFLSVMTEGLYTAGHISKKVGCSRGTTISYLKKLEEDKKVHKMTVDDGQSSVYFVL